MSVCIYIYIYIWVIIRKRAISHFKCVIFKVLFWKSLSPFLDEVDPYLSGKCAVPSQAILFFLIYSYNQRKCVCLVNPVTDIFITFWKGFKYIYRTNLIYCER